MRKKRDVKAEDEAQKAEAPESPEDGSEQTAGEEEPAAQERRGRIETGKLVLNTVKSVAKDMHTAIQKDKVPPLLDRQDLKPRFIAVIIDAIAAAFVVFFTFFLGVIVGGYTTSNILMMTGAIVATAYMLIRDGVYESASVGKMVNGLRVVDLDGHFIGIGTSIKRNITPAMPFVAIVIYGILNLFSELLRSAGWLLSGLVFLLALLVVLYETYILLIDREESRRPGDKTAGTRVVEIEDDVI